MKKSLLELTQDILEELNSDEVNSISDTTESFQVANLIRTTYYNMLSPLEDPNTQDVFQLEPLSNTTYPNYMKIPELVKNIEEVRYNTLDEEKNTYKVVTYCNPADFVLMSINKSKQDDVETVKDFSGILLYVENDKDPQYYTSFDDSHLVFDSYNKAEDTTLQQSKSLAFGHKLPDFPLEDTFIPDLPIDEFPILYNEALQRAFVNIKQVSNSVVDREARRQWTRQQNNRHKTRKKTFEDNRPNYGRPSR